MDQFQAQLQEWLQLLGPNPYLQAGAIVLASFLVAKLSELFLVRALGRIANRTKNDLDERFLKILHRPIFTSVVLLGLGLAAERIELPETTEWVTLAVLKSIAVIVWLVFAIQFSSLVLLFLSRNKDRFLLVQDRTLPLFDNLAKMFLVGAAVYFMFLSWNIDVTAWMASAGIIGLALSFAAKDTLANLFAGVFILADAPYKVGDYIVLDSGERGVVTQIGIRSTRLQTRDDIEVTIPNAVMGGSKILNESGGPSPKHRVRIQVSVAYGSDIDQVRDVLLAIAEGQQLFTAKPEPRVRFRRFGDSGLDFELLGWVDQPVDRGRTVDALNCEVYKRFAAEDIEIPYPKLDLYVKETPRGLRLDHED